MPKGPTSYSTDTFSAMFTAALFTGARKGKQPRCPSTDKWILKMWHINTVEHYSGKRKVRKNENHEITDWSNQSLIVSDPTTLPGEAPH